MDFKRLKYFCALVEHGSFSKAAKALYISQPPFSQRIQELEKQVGAQLLFRKGKSFQITPQGWEFYRKAQIILSHLNGLINDCGADAVFRVRIGICPLSLSMFLNSIPQMQREFPAISYRIWLMDNQYLETALQDTQLDFCILQLPLVNANYKILRLRAQPFVAVYGQGHTAPEKGSVAASDLENVPLLVSRRRDGGGSYDLIMRNFQAAGIEPLIFADTQECGVLINMLENGVKGVALLPLNEAPRNGRFSTRILDFSDLKTFPALVCLANGYVSQSAYEIIKYLFQQYRDPAEPLDCFERLFGSQNCSARPESGK